jgi:hypothetical protein
VGEAPRAAFLATLTALAAGPLPLAHEQYQRGTVVRGYCSSAAAPLDSFLPIPTTSITTTHCYSKKRRVEMKRRDMEKKELPQNVMETV